MYVEVKGFLKIADGKVDKQDYNGFPGTKLYFTEADPSSQILYEIHIHELELKLKLWLLLADHVILSTGHMIKSDQTFGWIYNNAEDIAHLAETNALIPSLSNRYGNCSEYASDQVRRLNHQRNLVNLMRDPQDRANFLDEVFPMSITWSSQGESHQFRKMMVADLKDSSSPLRQHIRGVGKDQIMKLSDSIAGTENFTRGRLISLVNKYCQQRRNVITRYGDCFYYLSGALFKDAFPVMHVKAANLCRQKVSHAATREGHTVCLSLWHEIMDSWGLTTAILDRLSLAKICDIRKDPLGEKVRETWSRVVTTAREGIDFDSRLSTIEDLWKRLTELFEDEVIVQSKRRKQWSTGRKVLQIGSLVTGGIGTVAGLVTCNPVSFGIGVLSFLAGLSIPRSVERDFGSTELVLLADEIREGR